MPRRWSSLPSYDVWHGGFIAWGPRYLVSLLPLLGLGAAGLLAAAKWRRLVWPLAGLLSGLGLVVQVLAVANNYLIPMVELGQKYPGLHGDDPAAPLRVYGNWQVAPVLLLWQGFSAARSDLAWLDPLRGVDWPALALSLTLLAATVGYLVAVWARPRSLGVRLAPLALFLATGGTLWTLMPRYAAAPPNCSADYRAALARLDNQIEPGAAVVTLDTAANCYFNYERAPNSRYGLAANDQDPLPPQVSRLVDQLTANYDDVWLFAPGPEVSATERTIRERLPRTSEWRFGKLRLLRARPGTIGMSETAQKIGTQFGDRVELLGAEMQDPFVPGQEMHVDLYWQALGVVPVDYSLSLQLLGPDGRLVAQDDRPAGQGQAPTSNWEPGQSVLDPRVIDVPPTVATGEYKLLALVYDSSTGARLTLPNGANAITLDTFVVG